MNHTQKIKLRKQRERILETLKYYEFLENMIKNDDEGKIPRMISTEKEMLIKWLEKHKQIKEKFNKDLKYINEKLNN